MTGAPQERSRGRTLPDSVRDELFRSGATSWFVPDPDLSDNNASAAVSVTAPR